MVVVGSAAVGRRTGLMVVVGNRAVGWRPTGRQATRSQTKLITGSQALADPFLDKYK